MKKRTIIIGIFILFLVGVISIIGTYAIDSTITEGNSSTADYLFNITLGNRTNREVVIPSYDSKIVDIKISNPNEFAMSYLLYIEGVNSNISVINIKDTEASGVLASKTVAIIQVFIQNNSNSDITIKIKDIVGFAKETLTLPDNSTSINKGSYYKAIVKSNNNTYGRVKPNIKLSTLNGILKYEIVPNTGYKYKSTTCNGSIANNILTISNITSNVNCEVVFEPIEVTVSFDTDGGEFGVTYTEAQEHIYTVSYSGTYKLEVWGAQGGSVTYSSTTYRGGYGGYSTGMLTLEYGQELYINVGGSGTGGYPNVFRGGGYNGGGLTSKDDSTNRYVASGGGATHIATVSGQLSTLSSNIDTILIVAGGGGGGYRHTAGAQYSSIGGDGGGYIGNNATLGGSNGKQGLGGTQTAGGKYNGSTESSSTIFGSFGLGGKPSASWGSAGGGGYYGGGASYGSTDSSGNSGGGGGSGYIGNTLLTDKFMYCYNCSTSDAESTRTYTTTNASSSPISNYAKIGAGAAKITLIGEVSYTISYGREYENLLIPKKEGYTFLGWYTGENGTGTKITEDTVLSNVSNHTLYAYWVDNTLYYKIKSNADTTTQIDFSKMSTEDNTNGIYTTTNTENGVPVYYYRGAVDNNHVLFANLCWKIIRTTETGGVKLIYDGVPSNGVCANTGASSYLPDNSAFNSSYNSPAYVGYMYGPVYTYSSKTMSSLSGNIIYGNDVTYDTETGKYSLVDTITKDVADWGADYTTIGSKYHYTCFTSSNTCTQVNYMHYSDSSSSYYFILTNGKKHMDILEKMLNNNTNESTAKKAIDSWYKQNMLSYATQLEDITFCNDRSIYSYGGWDKDASNNSNYLYFGARGRLELNKQPSLICSREIDKFTVNGDNGNGTLTYPVGLISADEIAYAGGVLYQTNASFYLYTGERNMWSLSPSIFDYYDTGEFILYSAGYFTSHRVNGANSASGLRPVVSLKPGTVVVEGNGSSNSPYVI